MVAHNLVLPPSNDGAGRSVYIICTDWERWGSPITTKRYAIFSIGGAAHCSVVGEVL